MFHGWDVHKDMIEGACIEDASSSTVKRYQMATTAPAITKFIKSLTPDDSVALESTTNAFHIANLLRQHGINVIVSNPLTTRLIADSKVKTDKIDAEALARLLAMGYLPSVWQPSPEIDSLRKITSFADSITRQKTMTKNRIHSILHRNLVPYNPVFSDLFGTKGRAFLSSVQVPHDERTQIDIELEMLDFFEAKLKTVRHDMAKYSISDACIRRLMTLPGIDYYTALSLKAAIGDITRFRSPKKLVSYLGLNPRVYQTGKSCYYGPITKRGCSHARWVLTQAAQSACKTPGPLRAFFIRLQRKKHRNKAIIAIAAKLARILWHMLSKNENYFFAPGLATHEKFARLKILAGIARQNPGRKPGIPSKGGKAAYLEKRRTDKDPAKKAEKDYVAFINSRPKSTVLS